jgi:hypothetical protein
LKKSKLDVGILYDTLYFHLTEKNYSQLENLFQTLECSADEMSSFCQKIMNGFDEKDSNSVMKTFMILTVLNVETVENMADEPLNHFLKWVCNVGMKYLKVPEYEPIILKFLLFFYQIDEIIKSHDHMRIFVEMIKQKTTISEDFDQVFRIFNTDYYFEEETLKELIPILLEKIYKYGYLQYYAMYFSIIQSGQYTPTTKEAKELTEDAMESMLKNEGNPWDIDNFDNCMDCKESLDLMSQAMSQDKELANDLLGLCRRFITLDVEDKKYEDWKYITVGIRSFTYFFEHWENFIEPELNSWIEIVLSKIDNESDFVKCTVIECIAILCDCLDEKIYNFQDLIIQKIPAYINHSTNAVKVLAIRFFNNFFEYTEYLNPIHIENVIKDYTEILKNQRDLMYNNSHSELVIHTILSCFQNFFQSSLLMDVPMIASLVDSIYKSSKFDEIRLKLICLLLLSLFNVEKESEIGYKEYLLKETVIIFNECHEFKAPEKLIEEIVSLHHEMFGDEYPSLIESLSIDFMKNKHFSKLEQVRNSSFCLDVNFNFK